MPWSVRVRLTGGPERGTPLVVGRGVSKVRVSICSGVRMVMLGSRGRIVDVWGLVVVVVRISGVVPVGVFRFPRVPRSVSMPSTRAGSASFGFM